MPSSPSSRRICWEIADCARWSSSPAFVKEPWRATAAMVRRCRSSMLVIVARPRPYVEVTFARTSITLRDGSPARAVWQAAGVVDVALEPVTHRLRAPLATSYGEVRERSGYVLSLTAADGVTGWGEAAPLEAYDGVPLPIVGGALERYAPILQDDGGRTGAQLLDACREVADLPQALAAVDMALWDAAGVRAGKPVCALLTDTWLDAVPVNATIG